MHIVLALLNTARGRPPKTEGAEPGDREIVSCERISEMLTAGGAPCSRQAVENWLSGRRPLTLGWYARLARVLALSPEDAQRGRDALVAHLEGGADLGPVLDDAPAAEVA